MKTKNMIMAIYNSQQDSIEIKTFFEKMAYSFNELVSIKIIDIKNNSRILEKEINYISGILTFSNINSTVPVLKFTTTPNTHSDYYIANITEIFSNVNSFIDLSKQFYQFLNEIDETLFDYLPLHLSMYNKNNELIYTNKKPSSDFPFNDDKQANIEKWILHEINNSPTQSFSFNIPTLSSQQMLVDHYQALYDSNHTYKGIINSVIDLKPILERYLNETAQAIVPWSDVTSGATIKNDDFDL